jgi:hypothetical protein
MLASTILPPAKTYLPWQGLNSAPMESLSKQSYINSTELHNLTIPWTNNPTRWIFDFFFPKSRHCNRASITSAPFPLMNIVWKVLTCEAVCAFFFSELWLSYYACPNLGGVYYHSAGLRLLNDRTSFPWSHCLSSWIVMTDFDHEGVYFCSDFFLCVPTA